MRFCGFVLISIFAFATAGAQEPPPQPEQPVHTLRVFMNTIQIPTLVLDEAGLPVLEKTHPKFTVSLDGGRPVPATHARVEGEDPISLAVLLDASGRQDELIRELKYSLPQLVGKGLRPHDHLSVYALDCTLVRTLNDAPAVRETFKEAIESALKQPGLHGTKNRGACADHLPVRDALMVIARALGEVPGRRVILAVTSGTDTASKNDVPAAVDAMQHFGTAVFGLALTRNSSVPFAGRGQTNVIRVGETGPYEPVFDGLCQTSGGLMLTANDLTLTEKLHKFTDLLRGRYIVEFPRADEMTAGHHPMAIEVVGKAYFIRAAGASMPIADPKLKNDPTVLRLPAGMPVVGPGSD